MCFFIEVLTPSVCVLIDSAPSFTDHDLLFSSGIVADQKTKKNLLQFD
jgi:hypothetical protein